MMDLLAAFGALRITGLNLFRKKVTEPLPWEGGRTRPERYRTSFALVHNDDGDEACIGCKMCEKICPSQIITVVAGGRSQAPKSGKMRGTAKDFTLDLNACIHCELCVQVCPEDAILMLRAPDAPGYSREEVFLDMAKLYANEPVAKSWGTGALLIAMQEPGGPKPAKPAAAPKPAAEAKPAEEAKAEVKPAEAPAPVVAKASDHPSPAPRPTDPAPVTPLIPQTEPPPPPPAPIPGLPEEPAAPSKPPQAVTIAAEEPTNVGDWDNERTQIRPGLEAQPPPARPVVPPKDGGAT
jgi:formate hydrogenlyase subunit 6/NADH:ubiquinone oxidoreductase subunit I